MSKQASDRAGPRPGRTPERNPALSTGIFIASLIAHASLAVALRAAAADHSAQPVEPMIDIELAKRPPPPPPPPPPPEEPPPAAPPPTVKPIRRTVARPAAIQPVKDPSPQEEATTDLPVSDQGEAPPAPPGPAVAAAPPPPPPPPAPPAPVVEAKEGANYLKNPRPAYPHLALREGWEGRVILRVKVLPNGKVGGAAVQKSAGRSVLDDAALDIVKSWTFVPATQGGKAIAGWVAVPFDFRIN